MNEALLPTVFTHPLFGDIRTVQIQDAPWFIAADIARVLDFAKANDLTRNIKKDYRGAQIVRTPSGDQQVQIINASGLFQAVMSSRKVQAEPFQKWVLGEVLPGIARTGAYVDTSNQMGETLAQATEGAIAIEPPAQQPAGPMVEVSMRLLQSLEQELVSSRIERRQMVQVFSRTVGQMVRIVGAQRMPKKVTDPDRPFTPEEVTRAELLFSSGLTGREVSRRLNRSHASVARFMAARPELLTSAIQASLV